MQHAWLQLNHIVVGANVATGERHPVCAALALARRVGARLTVVAAFPAPVARPPGDGRLDEDLAWSRPALEELHAWLAGHVHGLAEAGAELAVTFGAVGVELTRYAERHGADLIVLGRRRHAPVSARPRYTTDQVVRRSRVPCLCIPHGWDRVGPVLAALDGTARGVAVYAKGRDFARAVGSAVSAVTVESVWAGEPEPLAATMPSARSARLLDAIGELPVDEPAGSAVLAPAANPDVPDLAVRRGEVVAQVLAEAEAREAGVLAVGYRLHGPGGEIAPDSVARRLVHGAACAVLTVPL